MLSALAREANEQGGSQTMTHTWRVRARLPERFGQRCKILAVGRRNNIAVEFEDGYKVITCRYYVRRIKP